MVEARPLVRAEDVVPLQVEPASEADDRRDRRLKLIALNTAGGLILAVFYTLYFAQTIFVPIVLAFLLNLLLSPVVRKLARWRLPEPVGAALVLVVLLAVVGLAVFQLSGPASTWFERAPYTFYKIEQRLKELKEPVEEVREATQKVEELANVNQAEGETAEKVVVQGPSMTQTFFVGTYSFLAAIVIVIVLLYFLLASGDLFLRKLVQVLPRLHDKKLAIEIARRCERDISAYLLTVTCVNAGLGVVIGTAMWLIGLPNPVLWGVLGGLANFIPYLGPAFMIGVLTLVGLATFSEFPEIIAPPAVFFLITTFEGQLITPSILGRRLTLNPVVIFLALLIWGFLWGVPGILMAVPLLAALKIFCDNIPPLTTIGQFLGRREQPTNGEATSRS